MDRIKLMLNVRRPGNYAFFCPTSRLHLTRSNLIGYVDKVTPSIFGALRVGILIDVDGVIDLKTGALKTKEEVKPVTVETKSDEVKTVENAVESSNETVAEEVVKEETTAETKKKGRKKTTEAE